MKINLKNIEKKHTDIAQTLLKLFPDCFSLATGKLLVLDVLTASDTPRITESRDELHISAPTMNRCWTALGDWMSEGKLSHPNASSISTRALMLDASRNAVPRIDFLKEYLLLLAFCGLNAFCLYTEDTYCVSGEPLFGYGRGAYTFDELKVLDDFADALGIEVFPCIQTLGHFEQFLRYSANARLQDNPRVLNTCKDETYVFIERLITSATAPFRSKKIHIGLDEPWGVGRGNALDFDHIRTPAECFVNHIVKVSDICKKHGLYPMMWGDYLLGHSGEKALPPQLLKKIPRSVRMIYWDYTAPHLEDYLKNIENYRNLGFTVGGAPSGHTFGRFFPDFEQAKANCTPFIDAMQKAQTDMMLLTFWGDDGNECMNRFTLPSAIYALVRARGLNTTHAFTQRLSCFARMSMHDLERFNLLTTPNLKVNEQFQISGKMLFWDDPLYRYVLRMASPENIAQFCKAISSEGVSRTHPYAPYLRAYIRVLKMKIQLSNAMFAAYQKKNLPAMKKACGEITQLIRDIQKCHVLFRQYRCMESKEFGSEIIDHRFGGLRARCEIWRVTVKNFLARKIQSIEAYEYQEVPENLSSIDLAFHNRIFSRCYQLWV